MRTGFGNQLPVWENSQPMRCRRSTEDWYTRER